MDVMMGPHSAEDGRAYHTALPKNTRLAAFGPSWLGRDHSRKPASFRERIRRLLCRHGEVEAFKANTSDMNYECRTVEKFSLFVECTRCGRRWRIADVFGLRREPAERREPRKSRSACKDVKP